jgi:hypothetical protein
MATATATLPDGRKVSVNIVNGRTQTAGLPQGTTIHTQGGDFKISGGTGGSKGYTSTKVSSPTVTDQVYGGGGTSPSNLMEGGGTPGVQYPYKPPEEGIIPTEPTDPTSDYIQELRDAQRRSRIAALDKAKSSALSELDEVQSSIEPIYYDRRNRAAAQSDVGAMNFAQYMAARGIKGNAGAMPEIYRNAGLQGQIGALDQAQARDMAGIERQRGLIGTNYAFDVAQANADVESQAMQTLIDQYNRNRQLELQRASLTGTLGGAPTMDRQRMETEATGYYNPWASQYALDDDKRSQLAPYMGNLAAFIDENPTSPLYGYAQNARFEKIMSDPTLREQYGSQYQTVQGMQAANQNQLAQLQITAQELENSYLPETLKLKVRSLMQEVELGKLAPIKAQAEIDHIKRQTANIGRSSGGGGETKYNYKTDADFQSDLANTMSNPESSRQALISNAQAFITKYGVDGYNALLSAASK